MAFLNADERQKLLNDLLKLKYDQAKWKLLHIDPQGRMAYFRNNQEVGRWLTRFELAGMGTRVTLVERLKTTEKNGKHRAEYEMVEVIVEPTPDNRM
jgi:hypothetical protein